MAAVAEVHQGALAALDALADGGLGQADQPGFGQADGDIDPGDHGDGVDAPAGA
jgi:hypothetical protein